MAPHPPSILSETHLVATSPHHDWQATLSNNSTGGPQLSGRDSIDHSSSRRTDSRLKHPAAITSILNSFNDWELPNTQTDDYPGRSSPSSSQHSAHRYSWDRATSPSSSGHSSRFRDHSGMLHGIGALDEDHEFDFPVDAALSPIIPTSRPPSGLSHHTRSSFARLSFDFGRHRRHSSTASQSSNLSNAWKEKETPSKNKLSAESWVRQGLANDLGVDRTRTLRTMRALKRMDSQDAIRYPVLESNDEDFYQPGQRTNAIYRSLPVEQIIPKTPNTVPGSRGRLYLSDDHPTANGPSRSPSPLPDFALLADAKSLTMPMAMRRSSRHSHISDSVPTRTSSLGRTGSPSSTRKKDRRRRREISSRRTSSSTEAQIDRQPSNEPGEDGIPDSTWADLGEDDSTVRRILQLREQRTKRMVQESNAPIPEEQKTTLLGEIDQLLSRRSALEALDVSDAQPNGRNGLLESKNRENSVDDHDTHSGQFKPQTQGNSSPYQAVPKFDENHASMPSSPLSPKFGDISTLSVPQTVKSPNRERRRSLIQAFRSSSDRGRKVDQHPKSPTTSEAPPPGRGGLFRGRSTRRAANPNGLKQDSSHADLKLSQGRSPSDARTRSSIEGDGLNKGIDSVEMAIQKYLGAPRLSHRIQHPQSGREICFSDVGDPDGAVVIVCVGMGLTRYVTAFFDELAATLGLRLITLDRPGVGGSQPYPSTDKSGPLNWPDDVLAVCQYLNITDFSLLAHSAGAIYALATALVLPQMVRGKVHLLAPWIPLSQLEINSNPTAAPPPAGAVPRSQRILRALPASFLKAANSSFMTASSASLKPVSKRQLNANRSQQRRDRSPTQVRERPLPRRDTMRRESMMLMDQTMPSADLSNGLTKDVTNSRSESRNGSSTNVFILSSHGHEQDTAWHFSSAALEAIEDEDRERQIEYMSELTLRTWELATRDSNPATDLLVCLERNRDIGFRYTDVMRQTVITHGSDDRRVPMGNVKWLANQVNERAKLGNATPPSWDRRAVHSREGWADHEHAKIGCELRILQGEGHGLMASASIMSDVLTEIAGYSANAFANGL